MWYTSTHAKSSHYRHLVIVACRFFLHLSRCGTQTHTLLLLSIIHPLLLDYLLVCPGHVDSNWYMVHCGVKCGCYACLCSLGCLETTPLLQSVSYIMHGLIVR